MPRATFDPARLLDLFARVARDGSIVINFIDSNSLPFDISEEEFAFFVKDYDQSSIKRIDLSESNGVTNTGTSLEIELTEAVTTLRDRVYYYELLNVTRNKTWLCGNFTLHNGKFDGVNSTNSVTIAENGENITIQINEVGVPAERGNIVYVDDYGAVGDGVTDDTDAINDAINAAGIKGTVVFSANKTYLISRELEPLEEQTWYGYGARIIRADEVVSTTTAIVLSGATSIPVADGSLFNIGDDIILSDITSPNGGVGFNEVSNNAPTITNIVGNTLTISAGITLPVNGNLVGSYPSNTMVIRVFHMINPITVSAPFKMIGITIDGNKANNTSYNGWIWNSSVRNIPYNSSFLHCQFYNTPCENLFPTTGTRVIDCIADGLNGSFVHYSSNVDGGATVCNGNSITNACLAAFEISGHNEAAFTYSARSQRVVISNNHVSDCSGWLVGPMSADQFNDDYLIVDGNDCKNLTGILLANSNPLTGESVYFNKGITIQNNIFNDCDFLYFSAASDGLLNLGGGHDMINISNNIFIDTKLAFESCSNLTISGNNIIFNDGFQASGNEIPNTDDYAQAITFSVCVGVSVVGNTIINRATTQHSTLVGGIMLNINPGLLIKSDALTQTRYLYGSRNFNISGNNIVGFGTSIRDRSASFGQATRAAVSAVNCRITSNTLTLRNEASASNQVIEVCPGVVFENNTCYGGSNATRGIMVAGTTVTYDGSLNGGIARYNTIIGFNESIEVTANAGSAQYNAIVEWNLYDGTIDDNSGGNSTVANNTAIVNELTIIVNERQNPDFY